MQGRQAVSEISVQEEYLLGGVNPKTKSGRELKKNPNPGRFKNAVDSLVLPNQQVRIRIQAPISRAEKKRNRQAAGGNHLPVSPGRIIPDE
jgi:hypothetical protein